MADNIVKWISRQIKIISILKTNNNADIGTGTLVVSRDIANQLQIEFYCLDKSVS